MKKQISILSIVIVLLTLITSSCSVDDVGTTASKNSQLSVKVNGISTRTGTGIVSDFTSGNSIGIFLTGTGYAQNEVTSYSTNGTTWSAITPIYLTGNTGNVFAVYPAKTALTGSTLSGTSTFNVSVPTSDDFSGSAATDYMWGTGTSVSNVSTTTSQSTVTMKHALSKVSFIVNKDANYPTATGSGSITNITLSSATGRIVTSGTVTVGTGTFVPDATHGTSQNFSYSGTATINAYNTNPSKVVNATMLACPVAYTGSDFTLTMTIDGKTMSVTGFPAAPDWSGYCDYQYTITVSPTGLTVSNVSITPWVITPVGSTITAQ